MADELQQRTIRANGFEIAYLEAGPPDGPLALCFHGFPDSAWTWNQLLPALGTAGYHAVAPWQRGYSPTGLAPDGRYQTGALVADAVALHEALGGTGEAVLVGHDWGAMTVYGAAAFAPERFRRVVAAAVPPAGALFGGMLDYEQLKRSWYVWFFQTALAEGVVELDDLALLDRLWADWSPGLDASFHLARAKEALGEPARVAAAISYYRAMFDYTLHAPELAGHQRASTEPTPQPTLYLHGRQCGCLGAEMVGDGLLSHLGPGSELELVDRAGHFVHLDRPDLVIPRIVEFLGR